MKLIKFRAWHYGKKEMMDDYDLREYSWHTLSGKGDLHIDLMMWTGLTDKNGKEIYEGDIVIWKLIHPLNNNHTRTAEVYFDDKHACFWMGKDEKTKMLVLNDWMRGEYEVIGNKFDCP